MRNIDKYNAFLSLMPGGVYCCTETGKVEYFNEAICKIFDCLDIDELISYCGDNMYTMAYQDDVPLIKSAANRLTKLDHEVQLEHRIIRRDGQTRWVRNAIRLVEQEDGIRRFYGILFDETQNKIRQQDLQRTEERLHILADIDNDIIFDMDCISGRVDIYGDFRKRFGREPTAEDFQLNLCGAENFKVSYHLHPHYFSLRPKSIQKIQHDVQLPTGNGNLLWCRHQSEIFLDEGGRSERHIGRLLNAEDIKAKEEALLQRAQHDPLTGVYNRETAQEHINRTLQEGGQFPHIMMVLDLDNFKHINDTYGHPAGDWVLCQLSILLIRAFRTGDIIGRLGGDEFIVFLSNVKSREKVFQRILRLCAHGFDEFDRQIIGNETVTFSLGAAYSVQDCGTFADFYDCADKALYDAKRQGKGLALFKDL